MGKKASEALDINYDDLAEYLHVNHSVYMKVGSDVYYLTDVNYECGVPRTPAVVTPRTTSSTAPSS